MYSSWNFIDFILVHHDRFLELLIEHLLLAGCAVVAAALFALPMGVLASRSPASARPLIWTASLGETVPSLAVLGLILPMVGIGFWPSVIALTVKAILPILLNTFVGLRQVDAAIVDAAAGMGSSGTQRFLLVELPIAMPVIFAGVQTATVQSVAGASLAAFIGGGGLGELILQGLALVDPAMLLAGAVPIALLAIVAEYGMRGLEYALVSRGLRKP